MSAIAELRELQDEYTKKRNHCSELISKQDANLRNCTPSADTIRACHEREDRLRGEAALWQKRIDAIQKKLDEEIGLTDD